MKNISLILLLIIFFSCKKEEIKPDLPRIDSLIGNTYLVINWRFQDFDTGEDYNLLEVNPECDSIYIHFGTEQINVVRVDWSPPKSFYKRINYNYEIIDGRIKLVRDQYSDYWVDTSTETHFVFSGKHNLHNQLQQNTIQYTKMVKTPYVLEGY